MKEFTISPTLKKTGGYLQFTGDIVHDVCGAKLGLSGVQQFNEQTIVGIATYHLLFECPGKKAK